MSGQMNTNLRVLRGIATAGLALLSGACGSGQHGSETTSGSRPQVVAMTCPKFGEGELLYRIVQHIQDSAYVNNPLPDPKHNLERDGYSYLGDDGHLKPYSQISAESKDHLALGNQLENWLNNNEPGGFAASAAEYVLNEACFKAD